MKCLSAIIGAYTNRENMKSVNPVTLFWLVFLCKHVKKKSRSDFAPLLT